MFLLLEENTNFKIQTTTHVSEPVGFGFPRPDSVSPQSHSCFGGITFNMLWGYHFWSLQKSNLIQTLEWGEDCNPSCPLYTSFLIRKSSICYLHPFGAAHAQMPHVQLQNYINNSSVTLFQLKKKIVGEGRNPSSPYCCLESNNYTKTEEGRIWRTVIAYNSSEIIRLMNWRSKDV